MNNKTAKKELLFMIVLSGICAFLLGGTRAAIGYKADLSDRTIKAIFEIAGQKCEPKDLYIRFESSFKQIQKGKIKCWNNNENNYLLACEATGSGMWGEITIVFVYDSIKKQLIGLRVTEQKETAGLGSRISDEDFFAQFTDSKIDKKVDAISGATTSSMAVEKLLKKAIAVLNNKAGVHND